MSKKETTITLSWLGGLIYALWYTALAGLVWSLPVFLIWNWIMPEIFDVPRINVLEAWGLLFLTGALFRTKELVGKER